MTRKFYFWAVFFAAACASIFFTVRFFSKAFPIATVNFVMDRGAALAQAARLDDKYRWGPEGFRQAAEFGEDSEAQNYVELEGGGKEAFAKMLRGKFYSPYTWTVRHFKPLTTRETSITFTPEGEPYGFRLKIPEQEPGRNINLSAAREIAEKAAAGGWGIDFGGYNLVEQSNEKKTGGRIEQTFVYERPGEKIGEARYRLRLVVSGGELTELEHFLKIPEAFKLRFERMRSANDVIASAASVSFIVLYLLGGCVIGLFFLLRERAVIWKAPLMLGVGVAFLQLAAKINDWPLSWMSYDTALSQQGFVLQNVTAIFSSFVKDAALLALSFMAAEGLTRKAFPEHVQFWKLFSKDAPGSPQVSGRISAGYLLAGVFSAYQVALYLGANKLLGWWSPSDTIFDPNILGAYIPWFNSLAPAVHAGLWEECLFRAVPIAAAALIGQRLGGRKLWIAGALVLQAVIFGAAHANYANEPAYARPVELLLPAVTFGLLYIYLGLLPVIILHFTFDASWMSLPLFLYSGRGALVNQAAIVCAVLIPVYFIIASKLRYGSKRKAEGVLYNASWAAPAGILPGQGSPPDSGPRETRSVPLKIFVITALAGLLLWGVFSRFRSSVPLIGTGRAAAITASAEALRQQGVVLSGPWEALAYVSASPGMDDRFVWQKGAARAYGLLMQNGYLKPPRWVVRYAMFKGELPGRAEEYLVPVAGDGKVLRLYHKLPEAAPGAALAENEARAIARGAVMKKYGIDTEKITEISALDSRRPFRTDWEFEFSDRSGYPLKDGEPRVSVTVAGNRVADISRYIHFPEQWEREETNRAALLEALGSLCSLLVLVIYLAAFAWAIVAWSGKSFAPDVFFIFLGVLLALLFANFANNWRSVSAQFSAVQPYFNQALTRAGIFAAGALLSAFSFSAINAMLAGSLKPENKSSAPGAYLYGAGWALPVAGLTALAGAVTGYKMPLWPDFGALGATVPAADSAFTAAVSVIKQSSLLLFIFFAAGRLTGGWRHRKTIASVLLVLTGLVIAGNGQMDSLASWAVTGLILGAALLLGYVYIFRRQPQAVPAAAGFLAVLSQVRQGVLNACPENLIGAALAVLVISIFSYLWFSRLNDSGPLVP